MRPVLTMTILFLDVELVIRVIPPGVFPSVDTTGLSVPNFKQRFAQDPAIGELNRSWAELASVSFGQSLTLSNCAGSFHNT